MSILSYRIFCSYVIKDNAIIKIFESKFSRTLTMDINSWRLKFSKIDPGIHMDYALSCSLF
jgi:hypothetical protein